MGDMVKCKLRVVNFIEGKAIRTFMTCDDVREQIHDMKKIFRKENRSDSFSGGAFSDPAYRDYCKQLDTFLHQCQCVPKIALKCNKCSDEDHEGHFCRCEGRNIELARQMRMDNKGQEMDEIKEYELPKTDPIIKARLDRGRKYWEMCSGIDEELLCPIQPDRLSEMGSQEQATVRAQ